MEQSLESTINEIFSDKNIIIRKATYDDWKIIEKWDNEYTEYEKNLAHKMIKDMVKNPKVRGKNKILNYIEYMKIIEYNDNIIGMFRLKPIMAADMALGSFTAFFIDEKYRNMGIGRYVLDFVKEFSRREKYIAIVLSVNPNNKRSIEIYEKSGFFISSHQMIYKL